MVLLSFNEEPMEQQMKLLLTKDDVAQVLKEHYEREYGGTEVSVKITPSGTNVAEIVLAKRAEAPPPVLG